MVLLVPGIVGLCVKKVYFKEFPERNIPSCLGFLLAVLLKMLDGEYHLWQLAKVGLREEASQKHITRQYVNPCFHHGSKDKLF